MPDTRKATPGTHVRPPGLDLCPPEGRDGADPEVLHAPAVIRAPAQGGASADHGDGGAEVVLPVLFRKQGRVGDNEGGRPDRPPLHVCRMDPAVHTLGHVFLVLANAGD